MVYIYEDGICFFKYDWKFIKVFQSLEMHLEISQTCINYQFVLTISLDY